MTPKTNMEKIRSEARERKRNILHLILSYLREHMLEGTAEALLKEAQLDPNYQTCENVELEIILQEYQSYYYAKFQKYPKILRRTEEGEAKPALRPSRRGKSAKRAPKDTSEKSPTESEDFQFEIVSLSSLKGPPEPPRQPQFRLEADQYTSENGELINQISQQVIRGNADVKWEDCLGLEQAIETLKESVVYPLIYPEAFRGVAPWRGVLLHGPPGTGKTLLAKALASGGHTTFFNVTSSTFISKWRGESEKLIKHLFDMARAHAPSTIFFDEVDALVSCKDNQHEASKRFRSELLVQLDGISSGEHRIFVLASTNCPWDLDAALLRRFDKRIFIDMPSKECRIAILRHHLKDFDPKLTGEDLKDLGEATEDLTGSDLKNLCKEVIMSSVRDQIKSLQKGQKNVPDKPVTCADIRRALKKTRPSTSSSCRKRHLQWQNEHGAM